MCFRLQRLPESKTMKILTYDQFISLWNAVYGEPMEENILLFKTLLDKGYAVRILSDSNPIHKKLALSLLKKEGNRCFFPDLTRVSHNLPDLPFCAYNMTTVKLPKIILIKILDK